MRLAHLHLALGDRPHRLVEIDLTPFHLAHLAGALEKMGREIQGRHDGGITLIVVDRAQQPAERNRIGDCRKMLHLRNSQRTDQQMRGIAISARSCNSISEHATDE